MKKAVKKSEYLYIDIVKIIACFLVIVNHTDSAIFLRYGMGPLWFSSIITFFISKMAVPLFMLASGALMLSKEYDYKKIFKKVIKYVLVIIVIYFTYQLSYYIINHQELNIKLFIKNLYNMNAGVPMWYLYYYIAFLLMLPLLQKMVKNMKKQDYWYFFVVSFLVRGGIFILLPFFKKGFIVSDHYLWLFHPFIGLPLMGHYIQNISDIKKNKKNIFSLISVIIIFVMINVFLTYFEYVRTSGVNYLSLDNMSSVLIAIPAIALFVLMKITLENKNSKIIKQIASTTFLIYLIHMLFVENTQNILIGMYGTMNKQIAMYIYEIFIFVISYVTSCIILKIPILNKLFK